MAIRIYGNAQYAYLAQLQADNNRGLSTSYLAQYLARPDVAEALSRNQQAYPHLTPGAALAAAKAGQGPDSPITQELANAAAERRVKKGGGWDQLGDVLGSAASFLGKAIGFGHAAIPIDYKAVTRGGLAALNSFSEGVDVLTAHTARNISQKGVIPGLLSGITSGSPGASINRGHVPAVTTAQIALQQPKQFNLGSGFFPGGAARTEQANRHRTIYEIDGQGATLGRLIGRTVFEPGTMPYNLLSGAVDTTAEIALDPIAGLIKPLSAGRAAAKLLDPATPSSLSFAQRGISKLLSPVPRETREAAGLLETATRYTVDDNAARAWAATSNPGKAFVADARTHNSTQYFRDTYSLPIRVAKELADAQTDPEVLDVFSRHFLSGVLREKPNPRALPHIRPSSRFRIAGSFPRENFALRDDLDQAATQLEAHLRNGGITGPALETYIDRLARLPDQTDFATQNQAFDQIFKDAFSDIGERMAGQVDLSGNVNGRGPLRLGDKVYLPDRTDRGEVVSAPFAKKVTAKERVPGVSTPRVLTGEELYVRVRVGDRAAPIEVPVDSLSVHLPATKIRSMLAIISDETDALHDDITDELATDNPRLSVTDEGELLDLDPAHDLADYLNGAITLPDIRELRRLTSTYGRILNDPKLSWAPRLADLFYSAWRPLKILTGAAMVRNVGEAQVRMAAAGIRPPAHPLQMIGNIIGRGKKALGDDGTPAEDWLTGSQELSRLLGHTSRAHLDNQHRNASKLLRPYDPSFSSSWADQIGDMHTDPVFRKLAGYWDDAPEFTRTGVNLPDAQRWFWEVYVPQIRSETAEKHWPGYLKTRGQANKKVEEYQSLLEHYTRADGKLLETVAHGTLDGTPVINVSDSGYALGDDFLAYTRAQTGLPNTPTWVSAPEALSSATRKRYDNVVNFLFRNLYDKPTEKLVIIPTFRGFYFKRAQELLPRLDREAQERVITLARDTGASRAELRNLAHSMLDSSGDLTFDEFDAVAKVFASDESRKLLYEFQAKRQFGDINRHFFPFYDAWRDMIRAYSKLVVQNPATVRRMQVTIQGARGNDADPGTGFFHINPETGEEVFSFPFSGHLTKVGTHLLSGGAASIDTPLVHNVKNLNQFSHTMLPGVGPVIQWPVSRLLPNRPDTEWLHKVVNPVGAPNLSGTATSPWMANIIRGFTADRNKDRNYANTEADAFRYVMSTGNYDPSNEADMRAASDKATKLAKSMYYLKSLVGWIAPAQPSPEWRAFDNDGRLLSQYKMSEEFHKMANDPEIGYDRALEAFVTNFGEKNILILQSTSVGTSPDNSATYDWMRENPELVEDYPDAYNYFAPRDSKRAPFEAYTQSFATGARRLLTEKEWIAAGNDRLGSMLYYTAKEALGPKPAANQTAWLRNYRSFLRQKYPGFDPGPTDAGRIDRIVEQLYEAANDGILPTTTTGRAIQTYLHARDQAIESAARAKIVNWGQAKSTRNIRAWLRSRAADIMTKYPEFERVWDQVFSREMQED